MGHKVGLLDGDVYGQRSAHARNHEQPKVQGEGQIAPSIAWAQGDLVGFLNPGDKPLIWRGPMLHSIMKQFLGSVQWDCSTT